MTELPPIRRQVVVPGTREAAFAVFTDEIGLWWPLDDLSVYGSGTTVGFDNGRLVERGPDGREATWGTVLDWAPPEFLRITWHPAAGPESASEVRVRFEAVDDDLTLVTLEHQGWERFDDPTAARDEYGNGWPRVMGGYAARTVDSGQKVVAEGPVWLVLMHTAGPALPSGELVFTQPDFAEHIAFLDRMAERGVLVAAGSLDRRSSGMAVLRIPDPADVPGYTALAQDDDLSVARELLQVRVQPWHVAMAGV